MLKRHILAVLSTCVFFSACGKQDAAAVPAQTPDAVKQAIATAPTSPQPPAAGAVDVCALLAESDAIAVLGKLSKPPQAQAARGSLLGECEYFGDKGSGTVTAHPADELAGTVEYMGKSKPVRTLPALGAAAYATDYGVMVQPAGKPYFLSVFIVGDDGPALTEALARKLKL